MPRSWEHSGMGLDVELVITLKKLDNSTLSGFLLLKKSLCKSIDFIFHKSQG